jgi:elongation factor G
MTRDIRTHSIARVIKRSERPLERVRNIGIIAHIDAGKTTTTERMLYLAGRIHRPGDIDRGTTAMDHTEEERRRGITITSAATWVPWRGAEINVIDTPGHVDFTAEVERSLRVLDGGIGVFSAKEGVEPQSETVWRQADRYRVPRIAFVNKMDRAGADFEGTVRAMRSRLGANAIAIQVPVGAGDGFTGMIDVIDRLHASYAERLSWQPVPEGYESKVEEARQALVEALAERDDGLLARYLDGQEITGDLVREHLRRAVIARAIVPVLCGASLRDKGIELLLDAVVDYLPSPADVGEQRGKDPVTGEAIARPADSEAPFSGLAFKSVVDEQGPLTFVRVYSGSLAAGESFFNSRTRKEERVGRLFRMHAGKREAIREAGAGSICAITGARGLVTGDTLSAPAAPIAFEAITFAKPVVSLAIAPRSRDDRDALAAALAKIALQDPTFHRRTDPETDEVVISGMGELHLEVVLSSLARDHGVNVIASAPRVAYRQTIAAAVDAVGRHVKQSGGPGQYGIVTVRFEPDPSADPFVFVDGTRGGSIPAEYVPAVEKGLAKALDEGAPPLRVPFVNVRATLLDGKHHDADSSDLAFQLAAREAFKACVAGAKVVLLEPRVRFEAVCPEELTGAVVADVGGRRAEITAIEPLAGGFRAVRGVAPLAETFRWANDIRSITSGRGSVNQEPHDYGVVPESVAARVLAGIAK